jgi:uncharacterized protein
MSILDTSRLNRRSLITGVAATLTIPAFSALTNRRAQAAVTPKDITMEKVRFQVGGVTLGGDLYRPAKVVGFAPAVAIVGPMTYQKEQAPTEYAKRLAAMGYVALAYDSRYRGESGGEPRAWENPFHKAEDLVGAVGYLQNRADVKRADVSILGICQGSSVALQAAADAMGVRAIATVAGPLECGSRPATVSMACRPTLQRRRCGSDQPNDRTSLVERRAFQACGARAHAIARRYG